MSIGRNACAVLVIALSLVSSGSSMARSSAQRGEQFSERWCSQCRGVKPNQTSPYPAAPSFSDLADNPSTTRHSLTVSLRTTPHWTMPKIKPKSADIDDVVSYILSLRGHR
jgi:mono/diheme cytochrome c family protein